MDRQRKALRGLLIARNAHCLSWEYPAPVAFAWGLSDPLTKPRPSPKMAYDNLTYGNLFGGADSRFKILLAGRGLRLFVVVKLGYAQVGWRPV